MRLLLAPAVVSLLTAVTYAQDSFDGPGEYGSSSNETILCNNTFKASNASGIVTFPVDYPDIVAQWNSTSNAVINLPNPAWAISVASKNETIQTSIWYDTAGQNYSNDLGLSYDVCAIQLSSLPENTNRLGQNDTGDCSSALTWDCKQELERRAARSAQMWTTYASPPPYSNLSAGVLPTLCGYVQNDLRDSRDGDVYWPKECQNELGSGSLSDKDTAKSTPQALTGYNSSLLDDGCPVTDGNRTFHEVATFLDVDNNENYDRAATIVVPMLTVFFTVANIQRTSGYSGANATFTCLRARDFHGASRVTPDLPAGTTHSRTSAANLSGGAIAGIVVGVVVAVILLGCFAFWMIRRRRRQAQEKKERSAAMEEKSEPRDEHLPPEAGSHDVYELHPDDKKPEIDNGQLPELGEAQGKAGELYGSEGTTAAV